MRFPQFLGFPIALLFLSIILYNFPPFKIPPISKPPNPKLFTPDTLSLYNGSDPKSPILLSILGSVFDVTAGKTHYGPTGAYHHFTGKDASRAFVSGNFSEPGLIDDLTGLSSIEVKSVVDWRGMYFKKYTFVGKLIGRYYDGDGNVTKYLKGVEAKAARAAQLLEKEKMEEEKVKTCNSRWSDSEGSEVWCDEGLYPRLVERPGQIALTGSVGRRCGCYTKDELGLKGLEVYSGCDYFDTRCRV